MAEFSVELQDLGCVTEKKCLINCDLLVSSPDPESSFDSELSRVIPIILSDSSALKQLLIEADLSSSESLQHLITLTSSLMSNTLENLRILSRFFESRKSCKSSLLLSHFDTLKTLQNLSLFEEILKKFQALSQIPQECLLFTDLDKVKSLLKSQINELKSFEFLQDKDYPDFFTVFLSVFSSFIHLTNFYILTLTAKDFSLYVGMDEGFSGILSAANWASAVVFTFVYSYWSNYQYKLPTFICALFVVLGDITYFLAYPLKSPSLLLAGRLLIGVGGARVINELLRTVYY